MANSAVILDASGAVVMVVHPDREGQLDDPAFNLKGFTQVRIPKRTYEAAPLDPIAKDAALLKAIAPEVEKANAKLASNMLARAATLETTKANYEAERVAQKATWDALSEEEKLAFSTDEVAVVRK